MVLLADDDRARLDDRAAACRAHFGAIAEVLAEERGDRLTFPFERGTKDIEHFGFQDGVSQPLVIRQDIEAEVAARGDQHWDPSAPLRLLLVPEPGGEGRFGSFMVFRKLEQNVRGFRAAMEELGGLIGGDTERAGAMAVGRFRDGTPIVPTEVIEAGADPNDFHYDQDPEGGHCPFHAHIRKTNPRGDVPRIIGAPAEFERAMRIARRGVTYGQRPDLEPGSYLPFPEAGVGLLFMSFQASLEGFAIQQEGSDSNDFVQGGVGVDAVIGQNTAPVPQTWPSTGGPSFTMANFVRMLGGEYFYAPSMAFLRSI
jgi:deferrochelatase/peroxidase EfeB